MNDNELVPIGDVARVRSGYAFKSRDWSEDGIPVVKIANIKGGRLDMQGCSFVPEAVAVAAPDSWLSKGDILVSMTGYIGEIGKVRTDDPLVLNQRVGKFSILDGTRLDSDYFYYVLQQDRLKLEMQTHAYGAAQPNISPSLIHRLTIPLPPLPTQRKIADILSAYDDLIENNTRRIAILEEMAQRLYQEWFVHFRYPGHETVPLVESELGLIPEGWEVKRLGEVTNTITRGISPQYDERSFSLVINQRCIRTGRLLLQNARSHSSKVPAQRLVRFGDVLVNSTGVGTLGRVAQVYDELVDVTVDSHVTIVRPTNTLNIDYFGYSLLDLQSTFDVLGVGSTGQTELSRTSIGNVSIRVPPAEMQAQYSLAISPLRRQCQNLREAITALARTRDLVLADLVSGKFNVKDLSERSLETNTL